MVTLSSLSVLLTKSPFHGTNYKQWKRNLLIILTAKDYKHVLTSRTPNEPVEDAAQVARDVFTRWKKANDIAKCYILASVSSTIQHQLEKMNFASEIMLQLDYIFMHTNHPMRRVDK